MAGWYHRLNGHGFGWTPGVGDGQGGLACCGSWGRKESDMTEQLNWTELNWNLLLPCLSFQVFISLNIKTTKWFLFLELYGNSLRSILKLSSSDEDLCLLLLVSCGDKQFTATLNWLIYLDFSDHKSSTNSEQKSAWRPNLWLQIFR